MLFVAIIIILKHFPKIKKNKKNKSMFSSKYFSYIFNFFFNLYYLFNFLFIYFEIIYTSFPHSQECFSIFNLHNFIIPSISDSLNI